MPPKADHEKLVELLEGALEETIKHVKSAAAESSRDLVPVCGDCSVPQDLVRNKPALAHIILENNDGLLGNFLPVRKAFFELDARHAHQLSKEDKKNGRRNGP